MKKVFEPKQHFWRRYRVIESSPGKFFPEVWHIWWPLWEFCGLSFSSDSEKKAWAQAWVHSQSKFFAAIDEAKGQI